MAAQHHITPTKPLGSRPSKEYLRSIMLGTKGESTNVRPHHRLNDPTNLLVVEFLCYSPCVFDAWCPADNLLTPIHSAPPMHFPGCHHFVLSSIPQRVVGFRFLHNGYVCSTFAITVHVRRGEFPLLIISSGHHEPPTPFLSTVFPSCHPHAHDTFPTMT